MSQYDGQKTARFYFKIQPIEYTAFQILIWGYKDLGESVYKDSVLFIFDERLKINLISKPNKDS